MKFGYEHEEAVSPVIGVILMVAITVILAAIVGVFVFGMTDDMSGSKEAYLTATTNSSVTTIVLQSGKDLSALTQLKIKVDGEVISPGNMKLNKETGDAIDTDYLKPKGTTKTFSVGDVITVSKTKGTLLVTGKFADGEEKVLLQKNL
ncbi:type IV pilin [Methanofollis ethanolicus]|uniref:type IV pilin n=1 Tax=Methanofollis ethanolicus TaxID=488124 RepID=UPI00083005E5|nr:type IV pilin N-terminal domain-containing protein [Methanofollis ethanolicus]